MHECVPAGEQHRIERLITLAAAYLEVDWERLRGRCKDEETVEARHLLCYLLVRAGYSVTAIARLLERNHSTIVHAITRVEQKAALLDEGRRLVSAVLPLVGEQEEQHQIGTLPLQAVVRSLLRELLGTAPLRDIRAVRAYVCGPLLGRQRVPALQAAWGLCVIAGSPPIRTGVETALQACGLPSYRGLLDLQLRQAGV